jgi:hypothetical protein
MKEPESEKARADEEFDRLVALIGERASGQLAGFRAELRKIASANKRRSTTLYPDEVHLIDLSCVALLRVFMFAAERKLRNLSVVWHEGAKGEKPWWADDLFTMLISNTFNSLVATRDLATQGLHSQARAVFRQFVEVMEATIAALGNKEFLRTIMRNDGVWSKIKPAIVREHLSTVENRLIDDPDLLKTLRTNRSDLYKWLSKASHVDTVGIICGAIHWPEDENGHGRPTLGGVVSRSTSGTLIAIANYLWLTIGILCRLLNKEHRWLEMAESDFELETIGLMYVIIKEGPRLTALWQSREVGS